MFSMFLVLLSFSKSLAHVAKISDRTKRLFLNDEPCKFRPTPIVANPNKLKYYSFTISLNKCTGSCNVLSSKICIPKETKGINVKAFDMIRNQDEAKAMPEHISCHCKCKFNSTTCNSKQKRDNKTCQCKIKRVMSM